MSDHLVCNRSQVLVLRLREVGALISHEKEVNFDGADVHQVLSDQIARLLPAVRENYEGRFLKAIVGLQEIRDFLLDMCGIQIVLLADHNSDFVIFLSNLAEQAECIETLPGTVGADDERITVGSFLSLNGVFDDHDRSVRVEGHELHGTSHDGWV